MKNNTADLHKKADEACGREWECQCASCRIARNVETVETFSDSRGSEYGKWIATHKSGMVHVNHTAEKFTMIFPTMADFRTWKKFAA